MGDIEKEEKKPETMQFEDIEKATTHVEFDRRVLPIVCVLYVLSYLDRGNIGNAKTAGADVDLGLDRQLILLDDKG
ncbi:hypothetical protein SLS57_001655 [Botryosphaeria dothidea]